MRNLDYIVDLSKYCDYNIHIIHRDTHNPYREWIAKLEKYGAIQFYSYGKTPGEALERVRKKADDSSE